jgi:hypothetical protein
MSRNRDARICSKIAQQSFFEKFSLGKTYLLTPRDLHFFLDKK